MELINTILPTPLPRLAGLTHKLVHPTGLELNVKSSVGESMTQRCHPHTVGLIPRLGEPDSVRER